MNTPSVRRQLAAVYAKVPALDCIGKCANTCTTFPVPRAEAREIHRRTRVEIGLTPQRRAALKTCPLLTPAGRCGAHDIRPLICRLWGATIGMVCEHGCRPARWLRITETYALMAEIYEIGGQHRLADTYRRASTREDVERFTPILNAAARGDITAEQVERIIRKMLSQ